MNQYVAHLPLRTTQATARTTQDMDRTMQVTARTIPREATSPTIKATAKEIKATTLRLKNPIVAKHVALAAVSAVAPHAWCVVLHAAGAA